MMKKNNPQIDFLTYEVNKRLIPKDHFLIKVSEVIDFSYLYDFFEPKYDDEGRGSKDPVMMFKILLLEYFYMLSDPKVVKQIMSDVAFRWFLGLNLDDPTPDDTTISYFRNNRLTEQEFVDIFNKIVTLCKEAGLIKTERYIVDTTDVAANVNYPSEKKLIRKSIEKLAKEISAFNPALSLSLLTGYQTELDHLREQNNGITESKQHFEIAQKLIRGLNITPDALPESFQNAHSLCLELIEDYLTGTKDRIVSIVDKDARVAHKSRGNVKRGYKNHIIVDEDSEIILGSLQTPFNYGDEKGLQTLVNNVIEEIKLKPKEISADKVYGSIDNREFLEKNRIIASINFPKENTKKNKFFGISDFIVSNYLKTVTCPNGKVTRNFKIIENKSTDKTEKVFKFDLNDCRACPLREQCVGKTKAGHFKGARKVTIDVRHRTILKAKKWNQTEAFQVAMNRRYIVERRFATLVRNHGLRRSRYIGMKRTSIHIIMANLASNIVRMVALLRPPIRAVQIT